MLTSKVTVPFIRLLMVAALGTTLSACLPKPQQADPTKDSGSNFALESMSGDVTTKQTDATFGLPLSRAYSYSACLKDLARAKALAGQEFEIVEIGVTARADSAGCVHWVEDLSFNYLGQNSTIAIERTIKAKGPALGSVKAHIGLNPWSHGDTLAKPVDLIKATAPALIEDSVKVRQALAGKTNEGSVINRPLWLEDLKLIADGNLNAKGLALNYQVIGSPKLALSRLDGERYLETLHYGKFKIVLSLISQDIVGGKTVRQELMTQTSDPVLMTNDVFAAKASFVLARVPTSGQLYIGLKLIPENAPAGLQAFEGIYPMGDSSSLRSSSTLKISPDLTQDGGFKLSDFVTNKSSETPVGAHLEKAQVNFEFLKFSSPLIVSETATRKTIKYRVSACLKPGLDGNAFKHRDFTITQFRTSETQPAKTITRPSGESSCLMWDEEMSLDVYGCQHYIKGFVRLQNKDLGMDEKIEYIVNPWESGDRFAYDLKDDSNPATVTNCGQNTSGTKTATTQGQGAAVQVGGQNSSTISPDDFSFQSDENAYDYQIDQGLNLSVTKKVNFHLNARVLIPTSLSQGLDKVAPPLRDGPYVLRLVILRSRDFSSNNNYVSHVETLVNVAKGSVQIDGLRLQTYDLRALSNRNVVLVELAPADPAQVVPQPNGTLWPKGNLKPRDVIAKNVGLAADTGFANITISSSYEHQTLSPIDAGAMAKYLTAGTAIPSEPQDILSSIIDRGVAQQQQQLDLLSRTMDPAQAARASGLLYMNLTTKAGAELLPDLSLGMDFISPRITYADRADFWTQMKKLAPPVGLQSFLPLAQGQLTADHAARLCSFFGYGIMGSKMTIEGSRIFTRDCLNAVHSGRSDKFFSLENRLVVRNLVSFQAHPTLVPKRLFTETASFNLSRDFHESAGSSAHAGLKGELGFQPTPFMGIGVGGSIGADWSRSQGVAQGNSVSFSTNNSPIAIREMRFALKMNAFERCSTIRLQPTLFKENTSITKMVPFLKDNLYTKFLFIPELSMEERLAVASKGLMVCSGQVEHQDVLVQEKYYILSQDPDAREEGQDPLADQNRFFLTIRGESDYNLLMSFIRSSGKIPSGVEATESHDEVMMNFIKDNLAKSPTLPGHFIYPVPAPKN